MSIQPDTARIAEQVRGALDSADPADFAALLHPHVTWGAPGDPSPPCQNRDQVLAWYRHGAADGRRAHVLDVATIGDKILIKMTVTPRPGHDSGQDHLRWQVLTVSNGLVVDIRGYDDAASARAATGLPG